jgi:YD repeat-containing protein
VSHVLLRERAFGHRRRADRPGANNTTRYLYDQLGNLVQTTAPSGATTVAT